MSGKKKPVMGRPLIVKSPEEFEARAGAYFAEQRKAEEPITITGLALALGFCERQSLYDYQKRDDFSGIVKWARLVVESGYESNLHGNNVTGSIFALKNMNWSDKHEHELSGAGGGPLAVAVTRTIVDPVDD